MLFYTKPLVKALSYNSLFMLQTFTHRLIVPLLPSSSSLNESGVRYIKL